MQLYELFARDIDFRIAAEVAKSNNSITDTESVELVQAYQKILEIEKTLVELEEARINIVDEMNWASIVSEDDFDEGNYTSLLKDVADEVDTQQKNLVKLKDEGNVMGIAFDLCEKSVDVSLKSIGVDRQAYYGGTIIGNQCHKLLKPQNVDVVCAAIPQIVLEKIGDGFVYQLAVEKCRNYSTLFKKYGICHNIFNSACLLTPTDIKRLEEDIKDFMDFLRGNWPNVKITPKLHMIEDHIPFVNHWKVGCGFYGEQGGGGGGGSINVST